MSDSECNDREAQPGHEVRRLANHGVQQERLLLEYLDGQLAPSESRAFEAHMSSCPECEEMAQRWRQLDAQLEGQIKAPSLSTQFSLKVWKAIESKESKAVAGQLASPRPVEKEWAHAWAQCRRRFVWTQLPAALDKIGFSLGAGLLILVVWRLLTRFADLLPQLAETIPHWVIPLGIGLWIASLLVGVWLAAKRPIIRLFNEL